MKLQPQAAEFFIGYGVASAIILILAYLFFPAEVSKGTEAVVLVGSVAVSLFGGFIAVVISIWIKLLMAKRVEE